MKLFPLESRRMIVASLAIVSAVALAGAATARPGSGKGEGGCGHRGGMGHLERGMERLDLDAGTRDSVYAVLDASRAQGRELRREMREAREQMRALMEAEQPDNDAIFAQADTIGALRTEAQKQKLRTMIEVRSILTPEQWQELRSLRRERHGGRADGPGSR